MAKLVGVLLLMQRLRKARRNHDVIERLLATLRVRIVVLEGRARVRNCFSSVAQKKGDVRDGGGEKLPRTQLARHAIGALKGVRQSVCPLIGVERAGERIADRRRSSQR
jgi:hypothetical protein